MNVRTILPLVLRTIFLTKIKTRKFLSIFMYICLYCDIGDLGHTASKLY